MQVLIIDNDIAYRNGVSMAASNKHWMGKPSISMFLMIFYYIVVRMPLAYLLSYLGFGLNGIWVAVLVSHIVASLAATMTGTVLIRKKGNIKA